MWLWQAFKDQSSLLQACFLPFRRPRCNNPDIDRAVINATFHSSDLSTSDRRNIDHVLRWLRLSPYNLIPVLRAVSDRISRTKDWTVALKGLYLMHSIINSELPCVAAIGRLPFDLSGFNGQFTSSSASQSWPFDDFVRSYYFYLDHKSALIFEQAKEENDDDAASTLIMHELVTLRKIQTLIDLLLKVQPQWTASFMPLILEIMDWIIIEIYDLYSRICRGIAIVLMNICISGSKAEAKLALEIVQQATQQGENLRRYFENCRKLGIFHSSEFPMVDPISREGILELEQIINSFSDERPSETVNRKDELRAAAERNPAPNNESTGNKNKEVPKLFNFFNYGNNN